MQPQESKPSVCRRLFADEPTNPAAESERENMLNKNLEEINRDLDAACKKYNFDFRTEEPLEGDWVWEPVVDHPALRRVVQEQVDIPPLEPISPEVPQDLQGPQVNQNVQDPKDI